MDGSCWKPASWVSGYTNTKPVSTVQTLFLTEINSSSHHRRYYDLDAHLIRQLHRGRASRDSVVAEEKSEVDNGNCGKKRKCPFPGNVQIGRRKYKSPHFALGTNGKSGPVLSIMDEKIYFRVDGQESKEVAFTELDHSNFGSLLKIQFTFETERPGKFGNDRDVFYPPLNCDETVIRRHKADHHRCMLFLANSGMSVHSVNLDSGRVEEKLHFGGSLECRTVNCLDNGNIILECKKKKICSSDKDILMQFLILKHLPLRVAARVQVMRTISLGTQNAPTRFDIFDDFLLGFCGSGLMNLYDLNEVLKMSLLNVQNNEADVEEPFITHKVEKLPFPLLSTRSSDSYLDFYPMLLPAFCIVRLGNFDFEVREVAGGSSHGRIVDGCAKLNFQDDIKVHFLPSAPPRVVSIGRNQLKVFKICEEESSQYKLLTNENELQSGPNNHPLFLDFIVDLNFRPKHPDELVTSTRKSNRGVPRKYHDQCADTTLICGYNECLHQMAIVKFEAKKISCYVYDSVSFDLQYELAAKHFMPASSDVYDDVTLQFTNQYIAIIRKGTKDSTLYVFNLL